VTSDVAATPGEALLALAGGHEDHRSSPRSSATSAATVRYRHATVAI